MRTRSRQDVPLVPLLAALLLVLPGPAKAQRAGAPKLGVDGLVLFREEGAAAVLARATERWQAVSSRSEELLGDFRYLPEYASARARGQVFEVILTDGPRILPESSGTFVVVPWSFGPGCAEEGWQGTQWVAPGDTVTFLLSPTRVSDSGSGGQGRVFDVLGWHQPYPVGELIPFWRRSPTANPDWLSARVFYDLLTLLPTRAVLEADPATALERVAAWLRGIPGGENAFPLPEMRTEWRHRWGVDVLSDVPGAASGGGREEPGRS